MRLPNGFGSCVKLQGKRRRPYMVRITKGWTDDGKQIMAVLGYYRTKAEGIQALADYNQNPVDLTVHKISFSRLYNMWTKEKYGDGPIPNSYAAAYKFCESLYDFPFSELKTADFQKVIDSCPLGYSSKKNIKIIINQMTKYAIANDIVNKNYISYAKLPIREESRIHKPFSNIELAELWKRSDKYDVQTVLILIYTGLRPTELLKIKRENVFLESKYMMGGMKTAAGKNRIIPIADKIMPFISRIYSSPNGTEYLLADDDGALNYDKYRARYWFPAMNKLPMSMRDHLPHDGRHTCATLMDNCDINEVIKKKILGHAGKDVTEKVYTHKTINQLIEAINKI